MQELDSTDQSVSVKAPKEATTTEKLEVKENGAGTNISPSSILEQWDANFQQVSLPS
jgi:hypothetical protein